MIWRTAFAVLVYAEIVVDLLVMLRGGFAWYPWIPAGLALTGAALAWISASRGAGVIACLSSLAFATIGIDLKKYFGPLGFAAVSTLAVGGTALLAPRLARWILIPLAFIEAAWLGSLCRQVGFELLTSGHLTSAVDPCATYFLPMYFAFFLGLALVTGAGAKTLAALDTDTRARSVGGGEALSRLRLGKHGAYTFVLIAGAALGIALWHDWQISQPCM